MVAMAGASPTSAPSPTVPCCALSAQPSLSKAALVPTPAGPGPSHPPEDGRWAGGALVPKGYEGAQDTRGPHSDPQTPGPRDTADQPPIPPLPGAWCPFEHGRTHANTCTHTHSLVHCLPLPPGPGRRPFPFLPPLFPSCLARGLGAALLSAAPRHAHRHEAPSPFKAGRAAPSPGQACLACMCLPAPCRLT